MHGTQELPATLRVTLDSLVTLTLDVVNVVGTPVVLHFDDAQQYDFVIRTPEGAAVWQWSADRSFLTVLTTRALAVGEHLRMTESWRPTAHGPLVAEGWLTSSSHAARAVSSFVVR
ncbi:MAG: hypothetical protein JWN79_3438 [Gemmatimonadetes bacterium]|jgi:hypothetical protein|nr:hypothetical protein [Gemmatimonadota bacterium]